jgi:signal transduction histidine kinase
VLDLAAMVVDAFCAFAMTHMVLVYFLYGLGFFVTGVVVLLEASRRPQLPLAQGLSLLAIFGIIHGCHEWIEMFQLIAEGSSMLFSQAPRLPILTISFIALLEFGIHMLLLDGTHRWRLVWGLVRWVLLAVFFVGEGLIWLRWGGQEEWLTAADAFCRYSLAMPGAVLAAAGLFRQSRRLARERIGISRDIAIVGLAFLLYGVPGQVLVCPSPLPPSNVINNALFIEIFGFPIQVVRTVMAIIIAVFVVRALRLFEFERQRQMDQLNQARAKAQQRLDEERTHQEELRRQLLHQIVLAQEEERRHIARDLHDEASQAMTALSWKLAAVEQALPNSHSEGHNSIHQRIQDLRQLTQQVMDNLRQLTTRLRPAVLDELGLVPALIAHADDCSNRYPFTVDVDVTGQRRRLPTEIETTLYRIAQEALTNVAKHARATQANVLLHFDHQEVILTVKDDGVGMDIETAQRAAACGKGWGLAGICERVELVEGTLDIESSPGVGTQLSVWAPTPRLPCFMEENKEEARVTNPAAVS